MISARNWTKITLCKIEWIKNKETKKGERLLLLKTKKSLHIIVFSTICTSWVQKILFFWEAGRSLLLSQDMRAKPTTAKNIWNFKKVGHNVSANQTSEIKTKSKKTKQNFIKRDLQSRFGRKLNGKYSATTFRQRSLLTIFVHRVQHLHNACGYIMYKQTGYC